MIVFVKDRVVAEYLNLIVSKHKEIQNNYEKEEINEALNFINQNEKEIFELLSIKFNSSVAMSPGGRT